MEWVSVKDRLPTDYTTYIVCSDEDGTVWFMDYYGCGWESCDSDGESKIYKDDITHWMPLPPPPSSHNSDYAEIATKISKIVHDACSDAPHDIGITIINAISGNFA